MGDVLGIERRRARRLLLPGALFLACAPASSQAQTTTCGSASSGTIFRVENISGAALLNAATNCTDGGQLDAVWAGAVALNSPISIGAGTFLSVTGEDDLAEVQGGLSTRLFDVSSGAGLSLTQLKLSEGSDASGGAISASSATLTLDSCVFENNVATDGDGGAVWATGGELTIIGGEFSGNIASQFGGAVFAIDAGMAMQEGATFEGNQAVHGGAVYCGGTDSGADVASSCSLIDAVFMSNNASRDTAIDVSEYLWPWTSLDGGGAAAFVHAEVNLTGSVFSENYAQLSGGAVFGGNDTNMMINGCTFSNNTTPGYGGGITASSMTIGGNSEVGYNSADDGGGVFGWDHDGSIEFTDVLCRNNTAMNDGGCLHTSGIALMSDGVIMLGNVADLGGCLYAFGGCDMIVAGGEYTCEATKNGGFLFARDGSVVNVTNALVENNTAARRGAVAYCSGDSFDMGGSAVTIEGGTFINNEALEVGGALVAWGTTTVVTVKGGLFRNNSAKFYGGFIFVEEEASLVCDGATIEENYAGDQGGGIYAREATWINSTCELVGNESPQGAAVYLTAVTGSATFENVNIAKNLASGGSVIFAAESSVIARGVSIESGVGLLDDSSNRAMQLDSESSLLCERCIFNGWLGDTVIHSSNAADGSLVLDSCDFSGSAATTVVISLNSDAEIRNAVVSDATLQNVAIVDGSPVLVDRALNCDDSNACGTGECVDSSLGVLCECLENDECLDDGGALSLTVLTPPSDETYSPDLVSFELLVSATEDGKTSSIWDLSSEADELELEVVPSSGVLPLGGNITVTVTGSPFGDDLGGNLTSQFVMTSVGSGSTESAAGVELEVASTFYLCRAYEYAVPDEGSDDGISCEQCASIEGADGVDCELPGATLASLPVLDGYWRSSNESLVILSCGYPEACVGATDISSPDDYCKDGHKGPYCAVCAKGYTRGAGNICHSCEGPTASLLISAGAIFSFAMLLLVLFALVVLVGGLDAVSSMRQSVSDTFSALPKAPAVVRAVPKAGGGGTVSNKEASRSTLLASTNYGDYEAAGGAPANSAEQKYDGRSSSQSSDAVIGTRLGCSTAVSSGAGISSAAFAGARGLGANGSGDRSNVGVGGIDEACSGSVTQTPQGYLKSRCSGFGEKIKRTWSRIPLDKLKILVVVWQILSAFPTITSIEFPPTYSRFLSWIDVVNFNLEQIFSASCIAPSVNFYHRLLASTLAPIGLAGVLVLTYHLAKRRAGIGSIGIRRKRAAWSRHVAAGLLLTFLVFTSTSTTVFKTFACDRNAVEGESYLRADYSLSCETGIHSIFSIYAGVMLLVYPIGIPVLYAYILWKNRDALNPSVPGTVAPDPAEEEDAQGESEGKSIDRGLLLRSGTLRRAGSATAMSSEAFHELEERIRMRGEHPDLVPSMFLWKDFGPSLYYYEVIECGRRILLTGALIFIAPESSTQVAMACIFAFFSLLGFEQLRPHLDSTDWWLYRLGCVVIFMSNFLALLIRVEAAGEEKEEMLGVVLVIVNIALVVAVACTTWFATQQSIDDAGEEDSVATMAKTMLEAERHGTGSSRLLREGTPVERPVAPNKSLSAPVFDEGGCAVATAYCYEENDHDAMRSSHKRKVG